MLSPPTHLRPRAQSNPAYPKWSSRAIEDTDSARDEHEVVVRKSKKLQRPSSRRASIYSTNSTTSVATTEHPMPPLTSTITTANPHPGALPPARPMHKPARMSLSSYSRPSTSSGARDYKALWSHSPSPSASNLPSSNSTAGTESVLHKFVKRHRSISANVSGYVRGSGSASGSGKGKGKGLGLGIVSAGSLLTKAGREERREREREREKSEKSTRPPVPTTSPLSRTLSLSHESEWERPHSPSPPRPLTPGSPTSPFPMSSSSSSSTSSGLTPVPLQASNASSSAPHLSRTFSLHSSQSVPISTSSRTITSFKKLKSSYKLQPKSKAYFLHSKDKGKGKGKGKEIEDPHATFAGSTLADTSTARESQFVLKGPSYLDSSLGLGVGSRLGGKGNLGNGGRQNGSGTRGAGVRHHPFGKEEVPYPRSYERGVVDLDVWETSWYQQLCGSVTFHAFETPPTKVLDLGCGTGAWVLECAQRWKESHFVGLDVVPLQPDLQQIGVSHLGSRITWVQANFLEGLPFPNEEFDFVHVKRIARGVPEDKWPSLFEEITRVMKPGGAFEMFEEDLYFPGKSRDVDEDEDEGGGAAADSDSQGSPPAGPSNGSPKSVPLASDSPKATVRQNQAPEPESVVSVAGKDTVAPPAPASPRRDPSPKPLFQPPPLSRPMAAPAAPSKPHARVPTLSISTTASAPSGTTATQTMGEDKIHSPVGIHHYHHYQSSVSAVKGWDPTSSSASSAFSPTVSIPALNSTSNSNLVRTAPKAPVNPRDHSVLELIYTEMHAARFINLAPLSLLASDLSTWFKDIRMHSPLIFTFPPPAVHPRPRSTQPHSEAFHHTGIDDDFGFSDLETSPVRVNHLDDHPPPHQARDSRQTRRVVQVSLADETTDSRFVSVQSLASGTTPYAYFDDSRFTGFSPSSKASFPSILASQASIQAALEPHMTQDGLQKCETPNPHGSSVSSGEHLQQPSLSAPGYQSARAAPHGPEPVAKRSVIKNRFPNNTLQVDIQTLNLHLALRTFEILACAEAMWEWVLEFQGEQVKRKGAGRVRSASRVGDSPPKIHSPSLGQIADPVKSAIAELSRSEFDALLIQFNLDMHDQFAFGSLLEDRFAWSVIPMPATQDRILFDTACDNWDEYQRRQRLEHNAHFHHPSQGHQHGHLFSDAPSVISHLPTIPGTMTVRNATARPAINCENGARLSVPQCALACSGRAVGSTTRAPRSARGQSHTQASLIKEADQLEATTHPSQYLCRTMRVFVAWKA